jgi:hypothetical protein
MAAGEIEWRTDIHDLNGPLFHLCARLVDGNASE